MGFAEQNPDTRRYRPSAKVLSLAQQMRGRVNVRDRVHLHLVELVQAVRESAHLAVLDEGLVLYIDKVASDQPFGIEFRVGSRLPAHSTALGKALIAFDDDIDLDDGHQGRRGRPITSTARSTASGCERSLRTVRDRRRRRGPRRLHVGRRDAWPRRSAVGVVTWWRRSTSPPPLAVRPGPRTAAVEVQRSAERISEELRQLGVDAIGRERAHDRATIGR